MPHFHRRKLGEIPSVQQIAQRIRACCLERGWDDVELARRADISRTTLYNLKEAKSNRPRMSTLTSLAEAFELPLEQFLWGNSTPGLIGSVAFRQGADTFNRQTNHEVRDVLESHPHLFQNWDERDWEELYSTFGVGGALSPEGVISSAHEINLSRETRRQLNVVLETHLKDVAVKLIESLYRVVVPEGNLESSPELEALIKAHFTSPPEPKPS